MNLPQFSASVKCFANQLLIARNRALYQLLVTFLGCIIIAIALTVFITKITISILFEQLSQMFSGFFLLFFTLLIVIGLVSLTKLKKNEHCDYWYEMGMQAANGLSTLALTFTLLGISLGIGSLAEQPLTASNIQHLINNLTQHFAMAFMTTVVGLPTSSMLRALVAIKYQRLKCQEKNT